MGALEAEASSTKWIIWARVVSSPYPGGLKDKGAGFIDCCSDDRVARAFVHGNAFAGQCGFIHSGGTFQNGAVHRDAFAGAHTNHGRRCGLLQCRRICFLAVADDIGCFGGQAR